MSDFTTLGGSGSANSGNKRLLGIVGGLLAVVGGAGYYMTNRGGTGGIAEPAQIAAINMRLNEVNRGASAADAKPLKVDGPLCASFDKVGSTEILGTRPANGGQCGPKETLIPAGKVDVNTGLVTQIKSRSGK